MEFQLKTRNIKVAMYSVECFSHIKVTVHNNVKNSKLKKLFHKWKVIHALKQPKNLLRLVNRPKVENCISEKHDLYRYECKDSRCNLCALYLQKCSNFITSNGYKWKIRCHINVIVLMFYIFYHVTLAMVIPHTLAKL